MTLAGSAYLKDRLDLFAMASAVMEANSLQPCVPFVGHDRSNPLPQAAFEPSGQRFWDWLSAESYGAVTKLRENAMAEAAMWDVKYAEWELKLEEIDQALTDIANQRLNKNGWYDAQDESMLQNEELRLHPIRVELKDKLREPTFWLYRSEALRCYIELLEKGVTGTWAELRASALGHPYIGEGLGGGTMEAPDGEAPRGVEEEIDVAPGSKPEEYLLGALRVYEKLGEERFMKRYAKRPATDLWRAIIEELNLTVTTNMVHMTFLRKQLWKRKVSPKEQVPNLIRNAKLVADRDRSVE